MLPKEECRPQGPAPTTTTTVDVHQLNGYQRQDGYAAPTAAERGELAALAEIRRYGYSVSVRCLECGRPLTQRESVRLHLGPTCRKRVSS